MKRDIEALLRKKVLTSHTVGVFQKIIYEYFKKHRRSFPWRETRTPYHILISEIMLQQTQTQRVIEKYLQFIKTFPDFSSLANAPLRKIFRAWQGLGYNRRAIALKNIALSVMKNFRGKLPSSVEELIKLPGVGKTTASAVVAFAFNKPAVLIETNIRTVFLHFFFRNKDNVSDREILLLIEKTLDRSNPRRWYYALMDYGVVLKKLYQNPSRRSLHYKKQTPFRESNRQIRGMILKMLLEKPKSTQNGIIKTLKVDAERIGRNLNTLQEEGFIKQKDKRFSIV